MIEQKKKLRLDELNVESFVTTSEQDLAKGGTIWTATNDPNGPGCTLLIIWNCGPAHSDISGYYINCPGCGGDNGGGTIPPQTQGASCAVCETVGQPGCDTVVGQFQCP